MSANMLAATPVVIPIENVRVRFAAASNVFEREFSCEFSRDDPENDVASPT